MRGKALCIALAALALALGACAGGTAVRTQWMHDGAEVAGTFDVILYGGTYLDDLETIAILDAAGDGYEFVPFAPDFEFRKLEGLTAKEAMEAARDHVSFHRFRTGTAMRRILGEKGQTIGYELRPLYSSLNIGMADALRVDYWLREGGKVRVEVTLDPAIEKRRSDDGGVFIWGK